jgi:hypothetical protein
LILYESLLLKRGGNIYEPITPERFISGPYPPLFYWLASALLPDRLPDFSSPHTVSSIFTPGRIASLAACIVTALLIAALVTLGGYARQSRRKLLCGLLGGMVGAAVFLAMPQVEVWATRFRGDMLMIALTACGLTCVAAGAGIENSHARPRWIFLTLGAIFFSLAFYTKQTALAGPIAAALFLLARDWRSGLKWCGLMLALVAIPFAALEVATNHWFYLKMVDYHSLPLRRLTLERLLQFAFWEDEWPVILLAGGYALWSLFSATGILRRSIAATPHPSEAVGAGPRARPLPLPRSFRNAHKAGMGTRLYEIPATALPPRLSSTLHLIPLFILAAFLTLPTGAVVGADHNHLLMSGLAISAGAGALVAFLLDKLTASQHPPQGQAHSSPVIYTLSRQAYVLAGVAVAALIAFYLLVTSPPSSWYDPDLTRPSAEQQEQLRKIVLNVQQNPGTLIYADDPGIVALAGKETPYDDPFTMTALAQQGRWDESAFRAKLRDADFALLVLSCDVTLPNGCRGDTFSPGVLDAIRDGYDVLFRDVLYTYAPKVR